MEFPALDPRLDAPDGEDAWDENDLFIRERAPSMDAECIRAWLGGLQVYGEVERSKAYIKVMHVCYQPTMGSSYDAVLYGYIIQQMCHANGFRSNFGVRYEGRFSPLQREC